MDDLSAMINQVMSDPDSMRQIQSIAASLGLDGQEPSQTQRQAASPAQNTGGVDLSALSSLLGNLQAQKAPPPPQNNIDLSALSGILGGLGLGQQTAQPQAPDLSGLAGILGGLGQQGSQPQAPDLSGLAGILGGLGQQNSQSPAPDLSGLAGILGGLGQQGSQSQAPDLSGLSGILGGIMGNNQAQAPAQSVSNLSALTALLNGGNPAASSSSGGGIGGIDMGMIMKLSQALSSVSSNRANIDLLLALKPRLKEDRAKKVDDAIRVMQLVQFLPLIKESGLFGQMDNLLGGLMGAGGSGGIGNIIGNMGGGIGNVLGGLGLGGRR